MISYSILRVLQYVGILKRYYVHTFNVFLLDIIVDVESYKVSLLK